MHFGPTLEYWYAGTFLLLAVLQYQATWRQKAREARVELANLLKRGLWLVLRTARRSVAGAPAAVARIMFWIGHAAKGLVIRPKALTESQAHQVEAQSAPVPMESAAVEPAPIATVMESAVEPDNAEEVPPAPQALETVAPLAETMAQPVETPVAVALSEIAASDIVTVVETIVEATAVETTFEAVSVETPVEAVAVKQPVAAIVLSAQNDNGVETANAAPDSVEPIEKPEPASEHPGIVAEAAVAPAARKPWRPRISLRARLSAPMSRLLRRTGTSKGTLTTPDGSPTIDPAATAEITPVATTAEGTAASPVTADPMLPPATPSAEAAPPAYVVISGLALDPLATDAQTPGSDSDRLAKRIDKVIGLRATSGEPATTASPRFDGVLFKAGENLLKWLPGNSNIDLWHILVSQMTFDTVEEFKLAAWIVDRPLCDRATAAMVLAQISAEDCMHFGSAEECSGLDRYRWQIARTICERSEKGRYFFCDFNLRQAAEDIDLGFTLRTLRRRANELLQEGKTLPWPVPTQLLSDPFDGRDAVCDEYHVENMMLWLPRQKAAA